MSVCPVRFLTVSRLKFWSRIFSLARGVWKSIACIWCFDKVNFFDKPKLIKWFGLGSDANDTDVTNNYSSLLKQVKGNTLTQSGLILWYTRFRT